VVINCLNAGPLLYRNNSAAPRVAVRLQGQPGNTGGVGARIILRHGAVPLQSQEIVSGGRYLSSDDAPARVCRRQPTNRMTIEVHWRSGHKSEVPSVQANRLYVIREPATAAPAPAPAAGARSLVCRGPLGEGHTHVDPAYDDFQRQPLLPHALSQLGPGVTWYDLDGDGRDELVIGSGQTGRLVGLAPRPAHRFRRGASGRPPVRRRPRSNHRARLATGTGPRGLLIGVANYEDGAGARRPA
jgi:enediyne biosynthesis protein E4